MNPFLKYAIAGLLGIIFHLVAVKIPSLINKSKVAKHPFVFKDYLKDDWFTIVASVVCVAIMIITLEEVLDLRPALRRMVNIMFVFVGFTGSSIIQALLSVANKKIMQVIDVKTNIAEDILPPVTPDNVSGAREIAKEGTGIVSTELNKQKNKEVINK